MMDNYYLAYQNSRKHAGFSQERAAELLGIAPRTLAGYEAGSAPVPDDIADKMIDIYRAPHLGYTHLQNNPVARRYLPVIEEKTLSQAALLMISAAANYMAMQSQMVVMCSDGKIENAEAESWEMVNKALDTMIQAAHTLRFARAD